MYKTTTVLLKKTFIEVFAVRCPFSQSVQLGNVIGMRNYIGGVAFVTSLGKYTCV